MCAHFLGPGKIIINPATQQRNTSPITLQKVVTNPVPKTVPTVATTKLVTTPVTSKIIPPRTASPLPKNTTPSTASTNSRSKETIATHNIVSNSPEM